MPPSLVKPFLAHISYLYLCITITSRPQKCFSDTSIHPLNYPEELGAIPSLEGACGFFTLASWGALEVVIRSTFE